MGVGYICALGARQVVISFSDIIIEVFCTLYFTHKVQINYVVYDHMDTSIEGMITGSHN